MTTTYYIADPKVVAFKVEIVLDDNSKDIAGVYLVEEPSTQRLSENILAKLDPILIHNLTNFCARTDELERQWHAANFN
jgi:hypothetical protein